MTRYLSLDDLSIIHEEMLSRFGGIAGVRDVNDLSSAVGRLQSGYYIDLIEEAAALFESLMMNHPFLDGNKRTAVTATAVFLHLNGYKLLFNDAEAYKWMIDLLKNGRFTKTAVDEWLRSHAYRQE